MGLTPSRLTGAIVLYGTRNVYFLPRRMQRADFPDCLAPSGTATTAGGFIAASIVTGPGSNLSLIA